MRRSVVTLQGGLIDSIRRPNGLRSTHGRDEKMTTEAQGETELRRPQGLSCDRCNARMRGVHAETGKIGAACGEF